jgi:hypothetical protein
MLTFHSIPSKGIEKRRKKNNEKPISFSDSEEKRPNP